MVLKLTYFPLPGLAEATRLVLTYGNIPFEDDRSMTREKVAEIRSTLPFGQIPILTLDNGKVLAQSGALVRYAAQLAGLYPKDPYEVGLAEQAYFQVNDIMTLMGQANALATDEEKAAKRKELMAGPAGVKVAQLDKLLAHSDYVTGSNISFADFSLFTLVSNWNSGTVPGLPAATLDAYPHLKAHRARIASLPAVKAFYEKETDQVRQGYKPSA